MNKLPTALFVKYPFTIEDLMRPHSPQEQKPYIIEEKIELRRIDYENLITDLCVDRWFVEKYTHLCKIDDNGVLHCILVLQKSKANGVLIMSEGEVFPKWAAYFKGEVNGNE